MQSAKVKASWFPYAVVIAVVVVSLVFAAIGFYSWHKMQATMGDSDRSISILFIMLGNDLVSLAISVAFGLGYTQWLLERHRIAGLPGYAAVCIGVLKLLLGFAVAFLWQILVHALMLAYGHSTGMVLITVMNTVLGHLISMADVIVPIWLVFLVLRGRAIPASPHPVELRGRALLMFTMFAWSWLLILAQVASPMMGPVAVQLVDDSGVLASPLSPYVGSLALLLPAFLGALIGLPRSMPTTRPFRVWLSASLAVLLCMVAMVVITFAAVRIAALISEDYQPGIGFCAFIALLWFLVSIPLCGLLVRSLTREQAPPIRYDRGNESLAG